MRDAINIHLKNYTDEERALFFYRVILDEDFNYFRQFVKKIFDHKIWDDPDPSGEIAARLAKDDATTAKSLFDEKELTAQWGSWSMSGHRITQHKRFVPDDTHKVFMKGEEVDFQGALVIAMLPKRLKHMAEK